MRKILLFISMFCATGFFAQTGMAQQSAPVVGADEVDLVIEKALDQIEESLDPTGASEELSLEPVISGVPELQVKEEVADFLGEEIEEDMPNVMHESGAVCMSCHKSQLDYSGAAEINDYTCTPCHDASYLKLTKSWRKSYSKQISSLETQLRNVGNHPRYEDARHDLALLKKGGSWHNPHYADEILKQVGNIVKEAGGTPLKLPTL